MARLFAFIINLASWKPDPTPPQTGKRRHDIIVGQMCFVSCHNLRFLVRGDPENRDVMILRDRFTLEPELFERLFNGSLPLILKIDQPSIYFGEEVRKTDMPRHEPLGCSMLNAAYYLRDFLDRAGV